MSGLFDLVDEERLEGVWLELLECGSTTLMRSDAYRLLSSYRVLGNMLTRLDELGQAVEEDVRAALSRRAYLQSVVFALLRVVSSDARRLTCSFRALVVELPTEAQVILVEALVHIAQLGGDEDGISAARIIDTLPSEWALDGSCLILRLLRRASLSADAGSRTGALWLLEALLAKAVADDKSFYVGDLVDALLLRKSHDEQVAQIVVRSLPAESLVETLDALATVWGSRLFLARGDLAMQRYLTAAIVEVLGRIENTRLQSSGSSGCPLFVLLSNGISAYLDLSDGARRKLGMCIATKVAQLSGQELKFDEMQQEEQVNSSANREQLPEQESEWASNISSDSELEALDVEEEANQSATYLRDCLDLLRHPDTNVNAHDKHLQALTSIPRIVASGPLDSNDICSPLMKELVRMSNTFNMEKFDSLRGDAMLSLLVSYPTLALPACVGAIEGDVMLGCKLLCVRVLVRAAHALSGVPMDASTTGGLDAASSAGNPSSSEEPRLGTTRIKRPAKLARLKQRPRFFRNSFGPVALLFFRPIASALGAAAKKLLDSRDQEGEGIDSLLPAQLVLALGAFTTCAINSPAQQDMIEQTLRHASQLVRVVPLFVRRASLASCLAAIEALSSRKAHSIAIIHNSPLAALSNITDAATGKSSIDFSAAINVVEWCASHVQAEADKNCRVLMTHIVKGAIEL